MKKRSNDIMKTCDKQLIVKDETMRLEKIRVLQVLGILNRGGAEAMIMNLYHEIDKEKVQFDFVVHSAEKGAYDDEVRQLGGSIYHAPRYRGFNHLEYKKWWRIFFKEHSEYKLIHSHIRSTASIILNEAHKLGLKTIIHSHSTSDGNGVPAVVKGLFRKNICNNADYMFACSNAAGEWLYGKKAMKSNRYFVLRNAIDTKRFTFNQQDRKQIRKEFRISPDQIVLGTIGRITLPKNPFGILQIIEAFSKKNTDFVFLWVGNGELLNEVKAKIAEKGLSQIVIFAGVRADIPKILSAMDVFIFPSLWEGLPVSVIEAQASGIPCIISDRITREVCLSPVVTTLGIDGNYSEWTMEIEKALNKDARLDTSAYIRDAGYDIHQTATWLENFYLSQF